MAKEVDEPLMRNDLIVRISFTNPLGQNLSPSAQRLSKILSRALGNRITSLDITATDPPGKSPDDKATSIHGTHLCAITLDASNATRLVDRGPSTGETAAVEEFRKFWGSKAELRRFKDGAILECAVWDAPDGVLLTKQIITFILQHHFGEETAKSCNFIGNDFDSLPPLQDVNTIDPALGDIPTAFRTLETTIRSLSGLPLQIRQIQMAESGIRHTFPSCSSPSARHAQAPTNVVLQFEGSASWPDDLAAIQMTKIAFLLKLSELLSSTSGLITRIGLENDRMEIFNRGFLDIIYPSSSSSSTNTSTISFRLRIHHDRESTLLSRILASPTTTGNEREDAALALAEYKRHYITAPLHAQAIRNLITRFPAFAPSVKATWTWFSAHFLISHVAVELIELLVARVFLHPLPMSQPHKRAYPIPSTAQTGFLRTLLFLSSWDWETTPLYTDFGSSSPQSNTTMYNVDGSISNAASHSLTSIQKNFLAWRNLDPTMSRVTIFAASNLDPSGTTWTERRPSRVVAGRLSGLARAALKAVHDKGLDLELGSLFKSPLKDFDFVVYIAGKLGAGGVPEGKGERRGKGKDIQRFKNLHHHAQRLDPGMQGYAPILLFFEEIQRLYSNAVLLFHNFGSGSEVGGVLAGLWSPQVSQKRRWKVGLGYSTVPSLGEGDEGDEAEAVLNKEAILAEIARLGGDMVARIEVNR